MIPAVLNMGVSCCSYNFLLKPWYQKCGKEKKNIADYNNVLLLNVLVYFLWSLLCFCVVIITTNIILNRGFCILHALLSSSLAATKSFVTMF